VSHIRLRSFRCRCIALVAGSVVLVAACSGSSTPRAQSASTTSFPSSTTVSPTSTTSSAVTPPDFAVHLDWSVPLSPAPKGVDFVTDAVAAAADGTVYAVDAAKNAVLHYDATGRLISSWGHAGHGQGELDFQRATETVLISGIALDSAGNVYVAEAGNERIQEFDPTGRFLKFVGGPEAGQDGFGRVVGVAVDGHGSIYASDGHAQDPIQKFDGSARLVKQWGGTGGAGRRISQGGAAPVAVSSNGTVYAPDNDAGAVVVFDSNGTFRSAFGSQAAADGGVSHPMNAAIDDQGIVYVADSGNTRICAYDASGRFLGATSGERSGLGHFQSVAYVATRTPGHLFVIDDSRSLLLAFSTPGPSAR
jgi:tripartite motif-containing protein 71